MTQTPEQRRLTRLAAAYNTKARRYGVQGSITAEDLGRIELLTPYCIYCEISLEVGQGTFDHTLPLDKGGKNTVLNLVRCCTSCNRRKFTKSPEELAIHDERFVKCERPGCPNFFKPRWAEYEAGRARLCSRRCSALWRWQERVV